MIEMNNLGDQLNFEVRHGRVVNADYSSEICDVEVDGKIYMGVPIDMKLLPDDSPIHSKIHGDLEFSARVHIKNNIDKTVLVAFGTPLSEYPKVIGFKDPVPVCYMAVFNTNNPETCFTANRISSLSGSFEQSVGDSISYQRHMGVGLIFGDDLSYESTGEETDEFTIAWSGENEGALATIDKLFSAPIVYNLFYTDNDTYTSTQTFYPELDESADGYMYGFSQHGNYNTNDSGSDRAYIDRTDIIPVNNYANKDEVFDCISLMDEWQKRSLVKALGDHATFFWLFFDLNILDSEYDNFDDTITAANELSFNLDFDYDTALWTLLSFFEPEKIYALIEHTHRLVSNSLKSPTYGSVGTNSFIRQAGANVIKTTTHDFSGNAYDLFAVTGRYPFFRWDLTYDYNIGKYIFTNSWSIENETRYFGRWVHESKTIATGYNVIERRDAIYKPFGSPWEDGLVSNVITHTHSGFGVLSGTSPAAYLKFGNAPCFVAGGLNFSSTYGPPDGSKIMFIKPDGTVAEESAVGSYSQELIFMAPLKSKY